ncbi:ATPase WRNIP1 [Pygocentrus nattereri]|uniref:UBZ4-type domain-containing protein n=1 Tax=Pygocentrus nattereri TaxID=42514 RepID=A0A3B4DU16_PYGNA|nr:ATPase WRNIP1 [Pygocentrus nattereri]
MAGKTETGVVKCPVCSGDFEPSRINSHLDECLLDHQTPSSENTPPAKKARVSDEAGSSGGAGGVKTERAAGVFSLFHTKTAEAKATESEKEPNTTTTSSSSSSTTSAMRRESLLNTDKPLAEQLRPTTLEEYFGQNKVVGEQTLLRSLLQSQEIPSLIFWGPPGCGKTTLAHIIASSSKKKGTARFVTLSATSASTNDVREVIKQAQNELRLCKRKTILFIDEIHRFNKSQQDTFLPHVECGTITLIGATTENPSFQVNSALLSRCRVLVLEKLSVAAMGLILHRAVDSLGLRVLPDDAVAQKHLTSSDRCSEPQVWIEQKALDTIAHLCDGDARAGLNGLQLAVQACVAKARNTNTHILQPIVVQEVHIKEGLQRSHILYDKAGEEHYNCISALHKSMRGSDKNAALYWLGRMLEGGEDPLYVARRLVRFASEDVGLADPAALPQAVAAFQACHFIGMPECEVILAQCVVYLARAPKSVEVYMAYNNVKTCLRNHKGPLPPVPLHIRNAPTKLMKELGYAKGYKYNPAFNGPVDQEYLPEELRGINFFTWKPTDL